MTKPITDASTAVAEAIANKFIFGDGYTGGIYALLAYTITYNGSTWDVSTFTGSKASDHEVTAAWVGADNRLDIDLSALDNQFTGIPAVFVCAQAGAAHASGLRQVPQATATAVDTIAVRFFNAASPSAYSTSESTTQAFNIVIYGTIG
jgi:hypothetical protein